MAVIVADSKANGWLAMEVIMEALLEYFSSAGLSINPGKSKLVIFWRSRQVQEKESETNLTNQR